MKFLATPQAAAARGRSSGGFATGNKQHAGERLSGRDHAGDRLGDREGEERRRSTCPTSSRRSFGATVGQGEWGLFQNFLRNPTNVAGIQKKLESAAAAAYKKGK